MESSSEVMSNNVVDKSVCVEDLPENCQADNQSIEQVPVVIVKKPVDEGNTEAEATVKVKTGVKRIERNHAQAARNQIGEIIEEKGKNSDDDDGDEVEEVVNRNIIEEKVEEEDNEEEGEDKEQSIEIMSDDQQTKTINMTTSNKVEPDNSKPLKTASSVTEEKSPASTAEELRKAQVTAADKKPIEPNEQLQEQAQQEHEEVYEEEEEEETEDEDANNKELVEQNQDHKIIIDRKISDDSSQHHQRNENQIPQEPETQPQPQAAAETTTIVKEETVVDSSSAAPDTNNHLNNVPNKQENFNNTIKDIISSIDSNIQAEENIAALKEREFELLKKQQELAKEIEKQKLLAQKLANENQLKQQLNNKLINEETTNIPPKVYQPSTNVSKYTTFEETHDNNSYSRKSETFESRESSNASKKIDLNKIFTPATDGEEILPKNRKLYASSAFYSPTLHPTVEDQVELARRISHSLSDISNQQSRGQSMYVNRKKRSVKWVHEGCGQDENENTKNPNEEEEVYDHEEKENDASHHEKLPLKFLMNPSGQMRDINSLRDSINTETGLLSPDVSAEVVTALQAQKGKGAELFAKRRKVSEKWVVDENNVGAQSPSGLPDYHQYQQQPKPSTSPSILPAYTDAAKHRVQLNLHQEQLLEKYAKPGLKVVQTPWDAALSSGSASAAFVEEQKLSPYPGPILTPSPTPQIYDASQGGISLSTTPGVSSSYSKTYSTDEYQRYPLHATPQQQGEHERQHYTGTNSKRELAYKPSIPQGWKAPSMSLPKDLFMPKEIPLQSYAPPPVVTIPSSGSPYSSNAAHDTNQFCTYKPLNGSPVASYSLPKSTSSMSKSHGGVNTFPVSKSYQQGFSSTYGYSQPPKQQYLPPQSYQRVPQNTIQNVPQVNFNPSPLPYDKLAKFENQPTDDYRYINSPPSRNSHLNVRGSTVRNTSPAPFAASYNRPYTPSTDGHYYGGTTPNVSPHHLSSAQQYSEHNTPNLYQPTVTSNKILNAPSYNNSARGWGCSGASSAGYQYPQLYQSTTGPKIINAASMPYTDF